MSLTFLVPLFLLGVAGIVVPIVLHLTRRRRRQVVMFPSLMFLERIPFQEHRRRRIQHWFLLALRALALALLAVASPDPSSTTPTLPAPERPALRRWWSFSIGRTPWRSAPSGSGP
jgi:hypothetical protein